MGDSYSRIDLTKTQWSSSNNFKSLKSDEWRFIKPNIHKDLFNTQYICS